MKNLNLTNYDIDWSNILEKFDWLSRMEGVSQDPSNHGEIDLLVHVKSVTEKLRDLPEWLVLNLRQKEILTWTALLHDVSKPDTRAIDETGKITFHHHSTKGEKKTRNILYKTTNVDFKMREEICSMVRYHGYPLRIFDKNEQDLIKLSYLLDPFLLATFAKADILDRICSDTNELLDQIEFFKMRYEELECYSSPRIFDSNLARFEYFHNDKDLYYKPFDNTKGIVHMMSGLPGAGKDTYIENNFASNIPIISLDKIRQELKIDPRDNQGIVISTAKERAKIFLRKGQEFIWNATNISKQLRSSLIDIFRDYNYKIHIHYVETNYVNNLKQNSNRESTIPENVLLKLINKLEPPTIIECHELNLKI